MKFLNKNRGITLISLVLIIVILLILATISIAMLTGDNGILRQTTKAKEETEIANEKESIKLSLLTATTDFVFNGNEKEAFKEQLDNYIGTGKYVIEREHLPYLITLNDSNRTYIVKQNDITLKTKDYENIYAILYDDGTLTLSKYKNPIEGKTITIAFEQNINEIIFSYTKIPPWREQEYIDKITKVEILDEIMPNTSLEGLFSDLRNLQKIEKLYNLNTMNVTNMSAMFSNCSKLEEIDVSSFDTSQVINMNYLFKGCSSLTKLDVGSFDTSKVTSMTQMFQDCQKLINLDLSNFNTSNVRSISGMFRGCSGLTSLNVSSFDTSHVESLEQTFRELRSLTKLDLSNFNTSNVTSMTSMFIHCSKLEELNISNFDISKVSSYTTTFKYVPYSLKIITNQSVKNWLNEYFPEYTNIVEI